MVTRNQVAAAMVVYGLARSVIDDLKPADGEVSDSYDAAVFDTTMKSLKDKEAAYGKLG